MSTPSTDLIPAALAQRPLIGGSEVDELAGLFRVLASDTRLRILHTIARSGEVTVGDIANNVEASPQTVSNHLQRMADQQIVATRRAGNRMFYRLIDPCVGGLIELGLCLLGHDPNCDI
jgi:ArsR family transcriptional regulator, lead/cadmium/zinc/bismuth-responsive transcriptional repressor